MGGRPGIAALIALAALGGGWTFAPAAAPARAATDEAPTASARAATDEVPTAPAKDTTDEATAHSPAPAPPETGNPMTAVLRIAGAVTPYPMIIGAESVYTLTVTNLGTRDADDAVITDLLDRNVSPGPLPADCLLTGRTITCGGPGLTIPAGRHVTYDIPVTTEPTLRDGTALTNRAHVTAPDTNPAETHLVTRTQARADVELRSSAPPAASPGGTIAYTLSVTNHGPSQATDVTVQDPGQATITRRPPECPGNGRSLSCPIGSLAPEEARTLTYTIAPGAIGLIENCATVHAAARDDRTADNRSCARTVVEPAQSPSENPALAPPEPAPSPSHHERRTGHEDKERHEPRPAAAPRAEEADVPAPAHHHDDAGELPLTGASVWMLGLGVAVLVAIGLLVRYFSRQERDERQERNARQERDEAGRRR